MKVVPNYGKSPHPPGMLVICVEAFWLLQLEVTESCYLYPVTEAKNAAQYPTMHRTAPTDRMKDDLVPDVNSAKDEKLYFVDKIVLIEIMLINRNLSI